MKNAHELMEFVIKGTHPSTINFYADNFDLSSIWQPMTQKVERLFPQYGKGSKLSIVMCQIFRPYQVDFIKLENLRLKIKKQKSLVSFSKKYHKENYQEHAIKYNLLVIESNELLKPLNKFIKLYNKYHA